MNIINRKTQQHSHFNDSLWQDSFVITFRYSRYGTHGIHLAAIDNKPKCLTNSSISGHIGQHPDNMSWLINYPKTGQKYFTLQNVGTGTYLARQSHNRLMLTNNLEGLKKDYGLWHVEPMNSQGDLVIFNKSGNYAIRYLQQTAGYDGKNMDINLAGPERSNYNDPIYFCLSNRYLNLKLTVDDIQNNECLLQLCNGLSIDTLFVPTPDHHHQDPTSHRFKISLDSNASSQSLEFASHLNFDPNRAISEDHIKTIFNLQAQVSRLKIVKDLNLDVNHVWREISSQLSEAYKNPDYSFYNGLIWIPTSKSKPSLFIASKRGDLEFHSVVDPKGKSLKMHITANTDMKENHYFVMLIKRVINGKVSYLLGDINGKIHLSGGIGKLKKTIDQSNEIVLAS